MLLLFVHIIKLVFTSLLLGDYYKLVVTSCQGKEGIIDNDWDNKYDK